MQSSADVARQALSKIERDVKSKVKEAESGTDARTEEIRGWEGKGNAADVENAQPAQ